MIRFRFPATAARVLRPISGPAAGLLGLLLVLLCGSAAAAEYTLYENIVKFSAPPDWNVIMEKKNGNPQFIAFQVKDPADAESNELAEVTVNARLMHDSSFFQQQVDAATDKARQLPGFELAKASDPQVFRYYALHGSTRYEYKETFYLASHLLLHVRCVRPMLEKTTQQWSDDFDKGCAQVMSQLKPH